ncbi:hypothetical protein MRS45_20165 [Pseudomonas viridiflava]|uniref:DUF6861 domain-containing protein n=1 Tax=Pseudomonas viridiflava TaxID=33069 RepID=UPI000F064234|nr:ADP-ribosyltransferase domain-containing protein [Pseudomonas viridiflava]MCJ8178420.1 hypothetical protein [Pseudomonas viridiflava]
MDLLANVPSWDDIERNLDQKYSELNQSVNEGLQSAHDGWNGFTRRVSQSATQAYGYAGGRRIDSVRLAMTLSYPIIQANLQRKWASIEIEQILPVLLQLVKEVAMILGGSVAVGTVLGGAAGSFAFGVGAVPGAAAGAGIGLQVGNLILLGLGLSAVAEYFYKGLPACLSTLQEGMTIAWHAEDGLRPVGLDPTGGSEWKVQERIDRAARQLAKGQEQLVLLLLTAIVTYLTRGQVKAGIVGSMDSIAARSAKLQAEISNKQFANWLARNEQKLLAQSELRAAEPTPIAKAEPLEADSLPKSSDQKKVAPKPPPVMSLREAVGKERAERWIDEGRARANRRAIEKSQLLTDDEIGALYGYSTNEVYEQFNAAMRAGNATPEIDAFAHHATQGLAKLPSYVGGKTYRGVDLPQDVRDGLVVGGDAVDKAFMSSSATTPFQNKNTQMIVEGFSGKDISFLTHLPEAEVLYPPGVRFEVLSRQDKDFITTVSIKELP